MLSVSVDTRKNACEQWNTVGREEEGGGGVGGEPVSIFSNTSIRETVSPVQMSNVQTSKIAV